MPASVSGEKGHNRLYHAAMVIVDRFAVQDYDTAYELLFGIQREGRPRIREATPPQTGIQRINAVDKQGGPSCDLLNADAEPETYPLDAQPAVIGPDNPNYDPGPAVRTDIEIDQHPKILVDNNLHVIRADLLNVIQDDPDLLQNAATC